MIARQSRRKTSGWMMRSLMDVAWFAGLMLMFVSRQNDYVFMSIWLFLALGMRILFIPVFWWNIIKKAAQFETNVVKTTVVGLVGDTFALIFLYAVVYRVTGVLDTAGTAAVNGNGLSHDAMTCLYFSIVT
jgi:hypothetical protein